MYEKMTYDFLLKRALARVKSKYDKREGSIIFDSVAPITFELAEAYIMAEVILKETFATTADRNIWSCGRRSITSIRNRRRMLL